jgi:acyl carrier protein
MCVNMVVLRSDLSGDPAFSELIERTADGTLDLYEHQEVAFNQVVDAVQPARDPDRNPLFQVSIQLLGASNSGENLALPGVSAEYVPLTSLESRFDVAVNIIDTGSALRANVEYASDMFDRWRIEALLGHVTAVLRAAAADPELRLSQIPIVTGTEAAALLAAGRGQSLPPELAAEQVWVTDPARNLVPRGVPGELLAADEAGGLAGARRTGVRVRWTPDLRIEFLDEGVSSVTEEVPAPVEADDDELHTPTEESVAGIFGEVLAVPALGAEESFFNAGGNSLQAMRVVSRVNKTFGIKVSVRTMYGNPTVRAVAAAVDAVLSGQTA